MASAADMLSGSLRLDTIGVGNEEAARAVRYRRLLRKALKSSPTKWISPPPRLSWRQAALIGLSQTVLFALYYLFAADIVAR